MRVIVIGGGPAGMAAAVSAKEQGAGEVLLLERRPYLGGVLPQCVHTGFGTQLYGKDYTGGEYAWLWKTKAESAGISILLSTTVLSIERQGQPQPENADQSGQQGQESQREQRDRALLCGQQGRATWRVRCVSAAEGTKILEADAVILATGCRERTLPQMLIPGSRPAGVFTAGAAQLMMNMKNYLPGKSAVILGSGDIGLIMARRMTLEGIRVKMILGQESTGLARNIVQCVEDFQIPMRYGWTVVSTHGHARLKGVSIAPIQGGKREYVPCDTLLVATGLIPELEVCQGYEPGKDGLFVCGNAHMVHDLVDHVTEEALETGKLAAAYLGASGTDFGGMREAGAAGTARGAGGLEEPRESGGPGALRETQAQETDKSGDSFGSQGTLPKQAVGKQGNMLCTVCPKGCVMQVETAPFSVSGNQCEKGELFAHQELENPKRVLTTVVKTENPQVPLLSVRTDRAIDKSSLFQVMKAVKKITVAGPIRPGKVVAQDIAGTGADLVATWNVESP
ncbi:MAG: DUF1667 domain-containing protein [Firmicutes bacterium]|nr:DUF1667 domain-containing protein [Bacillota bacterium]NBI61714.1 DUF1667 domain-containing protein [Clostridiales bacterium]